MLQTCQAVLLVLLLCDAVASGPVPEPESSVSVKLADVIVKMPVEEYVAAVLAGETSSFRSYEALKAMAVTVRTYAAHYRGRHRAEGFDYCGSTHCQFLRPDQVTVKMRRAAWETSGEVLWFGERPAAAYYHADCGGSLEFSHDVWPGASQPYLKHQADAHCTRNGNPQWRSEIPKSSVREALASGGVEAPDPLETVTVSKRTASGRAEVLQLVGMDETTVPASKFRSLVGKALGWRIMPSGPSDIDDSGEYLVFAGYGAGHSVGLCQAGAEQMGQERRSYREILNFYYSGTTLAKTRW